MEESRAGQAHQPAGMERPITGQAAGRQSTIKLQVPSELASENRTHFGLLISRTGSTTSPEITPWQDLDDSS